MYRFPPWIQASIAGVLMAINAGCPAAEIPQAVAVGAADVEGVVYQYVGSHRQKDMDSFRKLAFWRLPWGLPMRGLHEKEDAIEETFRLRLEALELVEYPAGLKASSWDEAKYIFSTGDLVPRYVRPDPVPRKPGDTLETGIVGPWVGRLVLHGSCSQAEARAHLLVDPSLLVRNVEGRLYIYADTQVAMEAAEAVATCRSQNSVADPIPGETRRLAWVSPDLTSSEAEALAAHIGLPLPIRRNEAGFAESDVVDQAVPPAAPESVGSTTSAS